MSNGSGDDPSRMRALLSLKEAKSPAIAVCNEHQSFSIRGAAFHERTFEFQSGIGSRFVQLR
jgi:hypothetical protein